MVIIVVFFKIHNQEPNTKYINGTELKHCSVLSDCLKETVDFVFVKVE